MWCLQQKEIPADKPLKDAKPTRPIRLKATNTNRMSPTIHRTTRKSQRYQQRHYKRQFGKNHKEQALTITTEEKAFRHRSEQVSTAITNKIKQQFGFITDPNKTLLHNASSALVNTPTWYYFSQPSHLAFHDFTQRKQPAKNLRSLLGLGLKFIPTPCHTNTWKELKETSMHKFQQAIHLRFHFAGTNTSSDNTYDPYWMT